MAADKVMEMVRSEIQQNPGVKTQDLFTKAKKLDRTMNSLSVRQFHARFPLQVKRLMAAGRPRRRRRKPVVDREKVKSILLGFAKDLSSAQGPAVVDVVGNLDRYVDRIVTAAGVA